MQFLKTVAGLASMLTLTSAQAPFPIVTKTVPSSVESKISSDVASYLSSVYAQPAWTSASMALASELPDTAADPNVNGDPISLAELYLLATATPTWYSQLPTDIMQYISSVAAAEATIAAKDSGAPAETQVWMFGVVLAAGAVGMLLL